MLEGAAFFENIEGRTVRKTTITNPYNPKEECEVSTVFLCIDHGLDSGKSPVVFESLIFGGPLDDWMNRYRTWDEAEAGHVEMVDAVRQAYLKPANIKKQEAKLRKRNAQRKTWHEHLLEDDD